MRLRTAILSSLLFVSAIVSAQTVNSLSLFQLSQTYYNPAATGSFEVLGANFLFRQNLVGFEGAPSTQFFSVHAPLKNPELAMGVVVEHEGIGSRGVTGFHLNYAYRISMGSNKLSLGLKAGLNNASYSSLTAREEDDYTLYDDANTYMLPNFGVGILFKSDNYWFGASLPKFFNHESSEGTGSQKLKPDFTGHEYHFTGGMRFQLTPDLDISPSAMLIYSQSYSNSIAYNVNVVLNYKTHFKAGIGNRGGEADYTLVAILGYRLNNQFSLGYSYDLNMGSLSDYSNGAHEVNIQYKFGYKVNASNPRGF